MKSSRLFPASVVALIMSIGVTAGSLYVTVDAALRRAASAPVERPAMVAGIVAEATITEVPLAAGGVLKARFSAISTPTGVLLPSAGLDVKLMATDGRLIRGTTDADGICLFKDLSPGLYTIKASGVQGRISYGVRLTAEEEPLAHKSSGQQWMPVSAGLEVVLDSALTPARDSGVIDQIIDSVTVTPIEPSQAIAVERITETIPVQFDGAQFDDPSFTGHEPVELNSNGSLEGQVSMLNPVTGQSAQITDLSVSFVTDNRIVAETRVNPDGTFTQANLLPGVYSMVVAGKDGIGYMGVDVVGGLAAVDTPDSAIPVRMTSRAGLSFGILQGAGAAGAGSDSDSNTNGSEDTDVSADTPEAQSDPSEELSRPGPAAGAPAGPASGGFAIGGGSPGSGDGLGAALGIIGGAAAAILAADDDDGRPASPAR